MQSQHVHWHRIFFSRFLALGNCIWYDESNLLHNIKKKLKTVAFKEVPFPNLVFPGEVKEILESASLFSSQDFTSSSLLASNQQVRDLVSLESKAQSEYLNLNLCLRSYCANVWNGKFDASLFSLLSSSRLFSDLIVFWYSYYLTLYVRLVKLQTTTEGHIKRSNVQLSFP